MFRPDPFGMSPKVGLEEFPRERLGALDALRGIAVLSVLVVHAGQACPVGGAWGAYLTSLGRFGVQLFFIISAFTMCHMWQLRRGESRPVLKFYIRRCARIVPLFWVAILGYLLFFGTTENYWTPGGVGWKQILLSGTFLHGFMPDCMNSIVPGQWSIAVETTFYLIFPWLILSISTRSFFYILASALMFVLWFGLSMLPVQGWLQFHCFERIEPRLLREFMHMNILSQFPVFLLGAGLYFELQKNRVGSWLIYTVPIGFAAIAMIVGTPGAQFYSVAVALALLARAYLKLGLRSVALEALGKHSYGIYLAHFAVIQFFVRLTGLSGLAGFCGSILAAALIAMFLSWLYQVFCEGSVKRLSSRMLAEI